MMLKFLLWAMYYRVDRIFTILVVLAFVYLLAACNSAPPEPCISLECHKKTCVREQTRACQSAVFDEYSEEWAAGIVDVPKMMGQCGVLARRACR